MKKRNLRWLRLDNAAKIYPAARRNNWSNIFRVSATLTQPVDPAVLQKALDVTVLRFPSIAARLRRGLFWYYLQQLENAPTVQEESACPLTRMSRQEARQCALRVIVYDKRIAVELFHSLTDGNGAMVFLKSLVAEYLQQKYEITIPASHGILDRRETPSEEELEDSFQKYGGTLQASRKGNTAWKLDGTPEKEGFLDLTCFRLPVEAVLEKAHQYGVSVTAFLCAAMMMALQEVQILEEPNRLRRKSIKILIPVNLRKLFPSKTLRNFAMYTIPEIMPKLGRYRFEEICLQVKHRMGLEINAKHMSMMIATNISSERMLAVRLIPLFLKNVVMKAIFDTVGECQSCLSMSNLGRIDLPEEMRPYIQRFDFVLGVQATAPYNCGILSFGDSMYINFIRDIKEPKLEYAFYRVLRDLQIPVQVQSNKGE